MMQLLDNGRAEQLVATQQVCIGKAGRVLMQRAVGRSFICTDFIERLSRLASARGTGALRRLRRASAETTRLVVKVGVRRLIETAGPPTCSEAVEGTGSAPLVHRSLRCAIIGKV
jgi:hypothetical protein